MDWQENVEKEIQNLKALTKAEEGIEEEPKSYELPPHSRAQYVDVEDMPKPQDMIGSFMKDTGKWKGKGKGKGKWKGKHLVPRMGLKCPASYDINAARQAILDKAKAAIENTPKVENEDAVEWMIVDKELYVKPDGATFKWDNKVRQAKLEMMEQLISSALDMTCDEVGDIAFEVDVTSTGINNTKHLFHAPAMGIAHMKNVMDNKEVLVPNPYFADLFRWKDWVHTFKNSQTNRFWSQKIDKAFWRGTSVEYHGCDAPGNKERLEGSSLSTQFPANFDIKVTNDKHTDCWGGNVVARGSKVDRFQFAHYKYLANLPGAQFGSYSRNINHLFGMNSVVMLWESQNGEGVAYDEWYTPALKEGVTHVNINKQNANDIIEDLKANDEKAKELARGAHCVYEAAFSPCALAGYFKNVFNLLEAKQGISPKELLAKGGWKKVQKKQLTSRTCVCNGYTDKNAFPQSMPLKKGAVSPNEDADDEDLNGE